MKKIVISWIVCVLALVAILAWMGRGIVPQDGASNSQNSLVRASFTLRSADGGTVTEKDFKGRYLLVYFGYTHCPDICPTALLLMQNALSHLGQTALKVQPVFITVDPARDTAKVASEYASHFGTRMVGLSGSPDQIAQAAENFKVYYSKVEDKRSALGYSMDHSGFIYLMGPNGEYLDHFAYNSSEREIEEGLRRHVH